MLQRVARACVTVEGDLVSSIGPGVLLLVGVGADDAPDEAAPLARKIVHLRIFEDEEGKMDRSLVEIGGEALVVSQFTLYGDVRKGRRPSWSAAAEPGIAAQRVEAFARALEAEGVAHVGRGIFGAHMEVDLRNDGPVTLVLDALG